jgi:hypothetical protein
MPKRQIPRAIFELPDDIQASQLLENDSLLALIKAETPIAIEEAFRNKKTFATIFEINGIGLYVDIPKAYWTSALEQCISYNLEEEKFEECVKIKNLIEEIRKGSKTISKTTKREKDGTGTDRDTDSN